MRLVLVLLAAAVTFTTLALARRRGRLPSGMAILLMLLAVMWLVALAAVQTDFRDADGFVDCWPGCSFLQDATGVALFGLPVIALVAVLGWVALSVLDRRRATRAAKRPSA